MSEMNLILNLIWANWIDFGDFFVQISVFDVQILQFFAKKNNCPTDNTS